MNARGPRARRRTLRGFEDGSAILLLALRGGEVIGYAFVLLHDGSDDTFELAPRYAELYTLAVSPEARGVGVGTRLLDAVDEVLDELAIHALSVAVMADNEAAIRLYRRRGLVPGELVLYRVAQK